MGGSPDAMWPSAACGAGRLADAAGEEAGASLENVPPEEQEQDFVASLLPARTPFRPSQATVPETPSPGDLPAQQAAAAAAHAARLGGGGAGGRQFVDNTPSKGRVAKAQRTEGASASAGAGAVGGVGGLPSTYSEVVAYAERLFGRIRSSVAGQAAPTTLKAAFLEPLSSELATEVALELFAKTDTDYMSLFNGEWGFVCWRWVVDWGCLHSLPTFDNRSAPSLNAITLP